MFRRRTVIMIALCAFAAGAFAHMTWNHIHETNIWSNRHALETALKRELAEYRSTHSRYPSSLDEIKVDWIRTPERRKMLLSPFYYEDRGDSYVLWWHRDSHPR